MASPTTPTLGSISTSSVANIGNSGRGARAAATAGAAAAGAAVLADGGGFFGALRSLNSSVSNALFFLGPIGWITSKAKNKVGINSRFSSPLNTADALINTIPSSTLSDVAQNTADIFGHNHGATKIVTHTSNQISHYANRVLSPGMKETLSKNDLTTTLFAGTNAVAEGTNMVLGFRQRMNTLKHMQEALTGKKPSSWAVLTGSSSLHPIVAQLRGEAFGIQGGLATLLQTAGMAFNTYRMLFSQSQSTNSLKSMGLSLGVNMGTGMAASMLTAASDNALNAYKYMLDASANNAQIGLETYCSLIGGIAPNTNASDIRNAAQWCYTQHLSPFDTLQLLEKTNFLQKPLPQAPASAPEATAESTTRHQDAILAQRNQNAARAYVRA